MKKTAAIRRMPQQARSLAVFNSLLDETALMIVEHGHTDIGMNELARRSGVNIASIYQYFPNRQALLRQLIERYMAQYRSLLTGILSQPAQSMELLVDQMIDAYVDLFEALPVYRLLWAEAHSDPLLKALNVDDSKENARLIWDKMAAYFPNVGPERSTYISFMLTDLTGSLLQTALLLSPFERKAVILEYKTMTKHYLSSLR